MSGSNLKVSARGLEFDIEFEGKNAKLKTEIIGEFNASNLLAVLATLLASGISLADAVQSVQQVQSIAGRMEKLGGGSSASSSRRLRSYSRCIRKDTNRTS